MGLDDYLSIGAFLLSVISIWQSFRVSNRDKLRGEYDKKRDVFFEAQNYLTQLKSRHGISAAEKSKLDFDIQQLFGTRIFTKFSNVDQAIHDIWALDDDMEVLQQSLYDGDPQEAEKIEDLFSADPKYDPQSYQELQDFLDSWSITFLQDTPEHNRHTYSYREIEAEQSKQNSQIKKNWMKFEKAVKKKIKYR